MKLVICDDSKLARKSIEKALPSDWDVDISFAENGEQALALIEDGKAELLLLDLTMPVMDGFDVLKEIRDRQLDCLTIVISGDVQQVSQQRAKQLGALGFIKKPIDNDELHDLLTEYGLIRELLPDHQQRRSAESEPIEVTDILNEVTNVALGDAAKLLSDMLGTYIQLPLPKVTVTPYQDLPRVLQFEADTHVNAVSEGFVGNSVAGEAILFVDNRTLHDLPDKLSRYHQHKFEDDYQSIFLDIASVLIAAFLERFATQLDLELNISQPSVIGMSEPVNQLFKEAVKDKQVLVLDIDYEIPDYHLACDLFVIFTESSIAVLEERAGYLNNA
ncbi:MAG: response regulator [Pseudomonadota bacterium]